MKSNLSLERFADFMLEESIVKSKLMSLLSSHTFGVLIFLLSIVAGLAGQLLLKKGTAAGPTSFDASKPAWSAIQVLLNPYILSWIFFAGISAATWIIVVSKYELSFAYPVAMTMSYVLLLVLCRWFFGEMISTVRWIGILLMAAGLFLAYRS